MRSAEFLFYCYPFLRLAQFKMTGNPVFTVVKQDMRGLRKQTCNEVTLLTCETLIKTDIQYSQVWLTVPKRY